MKNLNRNEMNAVVGGIGPKASVSGALGGLKVTKCVEDVAANVAGGDSKLGQIAGAVGM